MGTWYTTCTLRPAALGAPAVVDLHETKTRQVDGIPSIHTHLLNPREDLVEAGSKNPRLSCHLHPGFISTFSWPVPLLSSAVCSGNAFLPLEPERASIHNLRFHPPSSTATAPAAPRRYAHAVFRPAAFSHTPLDPCLGRLPTQRYPGSTPPCRPAAALTQVYNLSCTCMQMSTSAGSAMFQTYKLLCGASSELTSRYFQLLVPA